MILQLDLHDFAILTRVRDEAGQPVYRVAKQGIKAAKIAATFLGAEARAGSEVMMLDRRAFIGTLGLLAAARGVEAQPTGKVAHIGFLSASSLSDPRTRGFVDAFRRALRDLGWIEGQNLTVEYRWAEDRTERLADLARSLVSLNLDLIVAATTPAIQAAKQATGTTSGRTR